MPTAHLQPPGVEKLEDLEDQKGGAQVRLCCGWAWSSSNLSGQKKPWERTSLSMLKQHAFEADEGLNEWQEDISENQIRAPFSSWPMTPPSPTGLMSGEKVIAQENEKEAKDTNQRRHKPPEGWRWAGDWQVDKNRAWQ
eukprot:Em0660g3a